MISHRHKCIFIHIERTGGCSIEAAFGVDYKFTNREEPVDTRHARLYWYRKAFPDEFRRYFKFTFVRNPWDRTLSFWAYRAKRYEVALSTGIAPVSLKPDPALRPFRDFVFDPMGMEKRIDHQIIDKKGKDMDMEPYLDFIGRFESLPDDFRRVCEHLGVELSLPHINKSDHDHYSRYYDEETAAVVAERCAVDIERFGYKFERV